MNNQLNVRKATIEDLEKLLEFEQCVIETERAFDVTLKREHTNYYDLKKMISADDVHIIVAEVDGSLIGSGYARIESSKPFLKYDKHAYLGFMYVIPEHRGKGINQRIIKALMDWAASKNVNEFRLKVYQQNTSAVKAYEKLGFVKHIIEMRMELENNHSEIS